MTSHQTQETPNAFAQFQSRATDSDAFSVVSLQGREALCRPYAWHLTLVSDDAEIDFQAMLKQTATLTLTSRDGKTSLPYHGILRCFEQGHCAGGFAFYHAILVPRLWRLSLLHVSRVFVEERPIHAILERVLQDAELTSQDYELRLRDSYRDRTLVCQYQESSLDFLHRWLEHEGMYYYFEQEDDRERLILVDATDAHPPQTLDLDYRPIDTLETGSDARSLHAWSTRQATVAQTVRVLDFNHRKAGMALQADAQIRADGFGEIVLSENFRDAEEGRRYARLRAEQRACQARLCEGSSSVLGVQCGRIAELHAHFRDDCNARYLITAVEHSASQSGALLGQTEINYTNTLHAMPADVPFRPAQETPRPHVSGVLSATIDAEGGGDQAELDDYGQYRVRMLFDGAVGEKGADKASSAVRLASPYAGAGHGMHFPLLKSSEVLLTFTDGDPDRPLLIAAAPNSEHPNVVQRQHSDYNRIGTAGGNEFQLYDRSGQQVIWLKSPSNNSSVGIGQTYPEDKGGGSGGNPPVGLTLATKGQHYEISATGKTSITCGMKTDISMSHTTALSASSKTAASFTSQTEFNGGTSVSWKYSTDIGVFDDEKMTFARNGRTRAQQVIQLQAGLTPVGVAAARAMRQSVRNVIGANLAANVAVAASGAHALEQPPDNLDPFGGSPAVFAAMGGASAVSTYMAHRALSSIAQNLIRATTDQYMSQVDLDSKHVLLTHFSLPTVPASKLELDGSGARITGGLPAASSSLDLGQGTTNWACGSVKAEMNGASGGFELNALTVRINGNMIDIG